MEISFTVEPAGITLVSLADAVAAADGTKVAVKGTVKSVESWSEQYGNMNLTITDGTTDLYIFRCSTKVEVGEVLVIEGSMGTYNSTRQIAQGSTTHVLAQQGMVTLTDAVALADGVDVVVQGKVKSIDTEYSSSYNNIFQSDRCSRKRTYRGRP